MLLLMETWSAACCWFPELHQLLDAQARLGQPLLDPGQRQGQSGAVPLQAAREFRDKSADHGRIRPRHVRDHQNQVLRILTGNRHHPSAQASARSRSVLPARCRAATRRRFSISARRSMMGIAHNSPSLSGVTVW